MVPKLFANRWLHNGIAGTTKGKLTGKAPFSGGPGKHDARNDEHQHGDADDDADDRAGVDAVLVQLRRRADVDDVVLLAELVVRLQEVAFLGVFDGEAGDGEHHSERAVAQIDRRVGLEAGVLGALRHDQAVDGPFSARQRVRLDRHIQVDGLAEWQAVDFQLLLWLWSDWIGKSE